MTRRPRLGFYAISFAALLSVVLAADQTTSLRVISATPSGEVASREDANEVRAIFSEPMIALGESPREAPAWFRITPAFDGTYRWSGTSILILTRNPAAPIPYATRYAVTIDRTATSASGRALTQPFQFTFTTPTVKLTDVRWSRQNGRFDGPLTLALYFNQPVRSADILAHTTVRHRVHPFDIPAMNAEGRARLASTDPDGLARYDAKMAASRQTYASTAAVSVRAATTWDERRFPRTPDMVVLETTSLVAPGAWLDVRVDATTPSPGGPAVPGAPQTSGIEMEPPFFVAGISCRVACEPSNYNAIEFHRPVQTAAFAKTVTVRNVTNPAQEIDVQPKTNAPGTGAADASTSTALENAGFDRQPGNSRWMVRIDGSLTSGDGETLGYPWIGFIQNGRDAVLTSFGDGHGVWEKDSGPLLPFSTRNLRSVRQWLEPLKPGDLMGLLRSLVASDFHGRPDGTGTLRNLTVTPDVIQSHGFDLTRALSPSGTGLAWAAVEPATAIPGARMPDTPRATSTVVQATNIGLTVKDSGASTLIFATRLDNAQPEPDVDVSIVDLDNKTLWKGKTNKDGVALAPALALRVAPTFTEKEADRLKYSDFRFIVIGQKNGDVAYVASDWNEGISGWEFGMNYDPRSHGEVLRGSVFTDRGVYRPGEAVHFKAILRSESATGVALLKTGTSVNVTVTDNRGRKVDARTVAMNKWSGADWTWTVPSDGSVGDYEVTAAISDTRAQRQPAADAEVGDGEDNDDWQRRVSHSFLVAAYRRPDFRVETTLSATNPIAGERLSASVRGQYLFGNPMAKRQVRWTIDRSIATTPPAAIQTSPLWEGFSFLYYPRDRAEQIPTESTTGVLDATGRLVFNPQTVAKTDLAMTYTVSGEVEDVSRQRIAASSPAVVMYPAPFLIGLRLPNYFAKTQAGTTVNVVAVDLAGRARPDVSVKLTLNRVQWNSVRRATGDGFYEWDTERVEVPAGTWTVRTGATAVAQPLPVPEGGYYEITAVATDADGHTTRTDTSFYGIGEGYTAWERYDHNRIELTQEKKGWKPGDTARVMIKSPWDSATALLTIEREGVRSYRRFALTSTQQTIEVPVTEADIPNIFVSVLLIRGRTSKDFGTDGSDPGKPQFRLGYTELLIDDASKQLTVKVKADREEYRPANKAKVVVTATDAIGKPVRGEVTLWAVDYGVLSLTGYEPPNVRQAVYVQRPLQVSTEDSRQRLISRRVLIPKGAGEGGGGGADAGAASLRKDFRPLAFWLGSVETNSKGVANTEVTLPDSLTTYHIIAVAGDAASRFGSATSEIRVSKPVTLLPALPRFLTVGDRAELGGAVTNTLTTAGNATVTIKSLDPAILEIAGAPQQVPVGAKETHAVRFGATARGIGVARVQMSVKLGANTDAFETTVPVTIVAPLDTLAASGETKDRAIQPLRVPVDALPGAGGLTVDLASTALVGLGEGARYVDEYPYACAEQKASRALVLLLASDLGDAFSMKRVAAKDYKIEAASLLRSLERYRCSDGGFTLWPGACRVSSTYLTAYVLDVMRIAGARGITLDADVTREALDFLERETVRSAPKELAYVPVWSASTTFAVKVLAEAGRNQDANITRLAAVVDRMPIFALSYLADALAASKDRGPRYADVIRRIANASRVERDRAHVESMDPQALGWVWDSNVSSTALVLEGFARRGDEPQTPSLMARWLLAARENGRWNNTHENALALAGLVAYTQAFEGDEPNFTATASLGARVVGTTAFKGRSTTARTFSLALRDVVASANAATSTDLAMTAAGTGTLFYTARLQYAPSGTAAAVDRGIKVDRRFETFVENGTGAAATSFNAGDLARVVLTVTVGAERRYVAVTDPLPAGFEAVDGFFRTTAADLAAGTDLQSGPEPDPNGWGAWWDHDGFDRIEKFDDRVELLATKLGAGQYKFSYLVRATTSGTFNAAGTRAEEMYAPDVNGRAAAATIIIK